MIRPAGTSSDGGVSRKLKSRAAVHVHQALARTDTDGINACRVFAFTLIVADCSCAVGTANLVFVHSSLRRLRLCVGYRDSYLRGSSDILRCWDPLAVSSLLTTICVEGDNWTFKRCTLSLQLVPTGFRCQTLSPAAMQEPVPAAKVLNSC